MSYTIRDHKLRQQNRMVEQIGSPYTSGAFTAVPKIAVMHFTAGASGRSSAEWFRNPANPGSSAHVVVDRDGSVIQCVGFDTRAQHAGRSRWRNRAGVQLSGLNAASFGIELANWGHLRASGSGWVSQSGVAIADPVIATHRNGNPDGSRTPIGWEPFPRVQLEAAAAIVRALVESYGVNEIVGHDDIAPVRKADPGPAFDMAWFRARVFGGRADDGDALIRVSAASGLNLRTGPGTQFAVTKLLAEGALLEELEINGNWLQVNVIDDSGRLSLTGWVHQRFTEPA
ncbi:MAG: N-acetylmuramoyl-L-alanine amidase [Sphingomonas sp.]|uniref:N-acetylmuramoyl-L-alanine amidase n=1 Tax=Sphingomonas sp. TaxID=28214 RepID=UPI000DB6C1CD|nr:N-acetylmuramyl-L-alanine amidase [Zymomonas sp.]MBA4771995.1 N-acetylmuramoyl-L-alanine amidase [Sphingomonas sp.]PZP19200.1 MAG: N-acetylmuramyl-L-alanine amidase [Sphingomonas hengshuiensis]